MSPYERRHRAFLARAQLRYAWQFQDGDGESANTVCTVGPGWYAHLERLFADVETTVAEGDRPGFHWLSLTEHSGRLAVTASRLDPVMDPLRRALELCRGTCRVCGDPGRERPVDDRVAVECMPHFVHRLMLHALGNDADASAWLAGPRPELEGQIPAALLAAGEPARVVELALRRAVPPPPRLNRSQREGLTDLREAVQQHLGYTPWSLRLAEPGHPRRPGGTLFLIGGGPLPARVHVREAISAAGFDRVRPVVLRPDAVHAPGESDNPWLAALAAYGSVELPRRVR